MPAVRTKQSLKNYQQTEGQQFWKNPRRRLRVCWKITPSICLISRSTLERISLLSKSTNAYYSRTFLISVAYWSAKHQDMSKKEVRLNSQIFPQTRFRSGSNTYIPMTTS